MTMIELALGISGKRPRCVDALVGTPGAVVADVDAAADEDAILSLHNGERISDGYVEVKES